MRIGVFESVAPCGECGGYRLIFSSQHNAALEADLLEQFERPLRFWNVAKKRRNRRFAADIKAVCEELREKTIRA